MEPQTFWNINMKPEMNNLFKLWVGDHNAMSKVYAANYCNKNFIKSIIDLGCGTATLYKTIQEINPNIFYTGVDSCRYFILNAFKQSIPIIESDIRDVKDVSDSSFDMCFTRHTLEHQPSIQPLLNECVRIASKEACIIFFIKPGQKTQVDYNTVDNLYHNCYAKDEIENELKENGKVKTWEWIDLDDKECALHIKIKL